MTEVFPLERAAEAYEHMMSGKARFRAVLNMASATTLMAERRRFTNPEEIKHDRRSEI